MQRVAKVHLHNPVLAYEVGDEFMAPFHRAAKGEIENFVLVVEGAIPNERINREGYWAAMGTDPETSNRPRFRSGSTAWPRKHSR
jgi:hydrogenase small subunit